MADKSKVVEPQKPEDVVETPKDDDMDKLIKTQKTIVESKGVDAATELTVNSDPSEDTTLTELDQASLVKEIKKLRKRVAINELKFVILKLN